MSSDITIEVIALDTTEITYITLASTDNTTLTGTQGNAIQGLKGAVNKMLPPGARCT